MQISYVLTMVNLTDVADNDVLNYARPEYTVFSFFLFFFPFFFKMPSEQNSSVTIHAYNNYGLQQLLSNDKTTYIALVTLQFSEKQIIQTPAKANCCETQIGFVLTFRFTHCSCD